MFEVSNWLSLADDHVKIVTKAAAYHYKIDSITGKRQYYSPEKFVNRSKRKANAGCKWHRGSECGSEPLALAYGCSPLLTCGVLMCEVLSTCYCVFCWFAFDFTLQKSKEAGDVTKHHNVGGLYALGRGTPIALFITLPKAHKVGTVDSRVDGTGLYVDHKGFLVSKRLS